MNSAYVKWIRARSFRDASRERAFLDDAMLIRGRAVRNEIRVRVSWELDMMHPWKFGNGRCEVSDCEPNLIGVLSSRERPSGFVRLSSTHIFIQARPDFCDKFPLIKKVSSYFVYSISKKISKDIPEYFYIYLYIFILFFNSSKIIRL